jgi:hypothetical protein
VEAAVSGILLMTVSFSADEAEVFCGSLTSFVEICPASGSFSSILRSVELLSVLISEIYDVVSLGADAASLTWHPQKKHIAIAGVMRKVT